MTSGAINKPRVAGLIARYWWLFFIPALFAFYLAFVSLLVEMGKASDPDSQANIYFETALTLAPWHSDAAASYGSHLRAYAVALPAGQERRDTLEQVLSLYEQAMKGRPLWPYYHLGAFDAEYLLGRPAGVIQSRFDLVTELAPNERGLDRNLLELSLYNWQYLRPDQKQWVAHRLQKTQGSIRRDMLDIIRELKAYNLNLCLELPWKLVRRACRE
ncbi:MAG: hypothetical protein QF808_02630 [Thalassolituus sp.]|jgi:hypothetical protein|uniref:hypothetical protein n=1 Tax=Thalassolituus sp. TaxID=2030822 RepID=UPI0027D6F72A|nr:hypothetical protein [Thalassolituus sp.]MDQ4422783.1 hypothetical protein [Thalassolituus sp.]MDQ4427543.1 hypothetical protein [Thalassolituus sp.]